MPTDAPDAVQRLIAQWRATANRRLNESASANDFVQGTAAARMNLAEDLEHLHQTVLLPAIQAARRALSLIQDLGTHPELAEELSDKLAALYAPAGGEGTHK